MSPRQANLVTAAALVAFTALIALTAPRWSRLLVRPLPESPAEGGAARAENGGEAEPAAPAEGRINVKLFFQDGERRGLQIEERPVAASRDLSRQIRAVVEELVKGPQRQDLQPTLAAETKVLEVFVSARGVAYVDLSADVQHPQRAGSEAELITVYSLVNSLTVNFPAVKRVQLLVDDKPAQTLAGHVDISRPLPADMTYLAASSMTPVATSAGPADANDGSVRGEGQGGGAVKR